MLRRFWWKCLSWMRLELAMEIIGGRVQRTGLEQWSMLARAILI